MATQFQIRSYDKTAFESLTTAGVLRPIAQALAARGVTCPDDLREDWKAMLPPSTLEGTESRSAFSGSPRKEGPCRHRRRL